MCCETTITQYAVRRERGVLLPVRHQLDSHSRTGLVRRIRTRSNRRRLYALCVDHGEIIIFPVYGGHCASAMPVIKPPPTGIIVIIYYERFFFFFNRIAVRLDSFPRQGTMTRLIYDVSPLSLGPETPLFGQVPFKTAPIRILTVTDY